MPLEFQPRGGGYRVVRAAEGGRPEQMLAALSTEAQDGPRWNPLPYAECTVHSAVGPLAVRDLEEILAELKKMRRAELEKAREAALKALKDLGE